MDLLIDQSTWVPVISIVSRAIDPIAELHATAITCQPSRHRKIPGSHSNSKKITHSIGRRPKRTKTLFCPSLPAFCAARDAPPCSQISDQLRHY
jgi:hypothetical protein